MIELDGSRNEAGGQVLRSALALSMCTGQPFRITNIRLSRDMPGLLRQHLAAVNAAADVCNADVIGAQLGSRELTFKPRMCHSGDYVFEVGRGSSALILQTVLPALLLQGAASSVRIVGTTHVRQAPAFDCLQRAFTPLLERMGARVQLSLIGYGFHSTADGGIQADIEPSRLHPLELHDRGARISQFAECYLAGLPLDVGQRELATIARTLHWSSDQLHIRALPPSLGKGNALSITLAFQHVTEVFTAVADDSIRAEVLAQDVAYEAEQYLAHSAPIGAYLADQLLLPLALCGRGSFTTTTITAHIQSNAAVIEAFTGRRVLIQPAHEGYRIKIE